MSEEVIEESIVYDSITIPRTAIMKIRNITGIADTQEAVEEFCYLCISYFKDPQSELIKLINENSN